MTELFKGKLNRVDFLLRLICFFGFGWFFGSLADSLDYEELIKSRRDVSIFMIFDANFWINFLIRVIHFIPIIINIFIYSIIIRRLNDIKWSKNWMFLLIIPHILITITNIHGYFISTAEYPLEELYERILSNIFLITILLSPFIIIISIKKSKSTYDYDNQPFISTKIMAFISIIPIIYLITLLLAVKTIINL